MTVAVATPEIRYLLTGSSLGPFSTVFTYDSPAQVVAYLDTTLAYVQLSQGTDYTLTGSTPSTSGGQATLASYLLPVGGWPAGASVTLVRVTSKDQPSAFGEIDSFSPEAGEQALDHVVRGLQEAAQVQARVIAAPPGEAGQTLPGLSARAGKIAMFDAVSGAVIGWITPAALTALVGQPIPAAGAASPVAGTSAAVEWKWEESPTTAESYGSNWTGNAYFTWAFNKDFTAVNAPGSSSGIAAANVAIASNSGAGVPVAANLAFAQGKATNAVTSGRITIVRGDSHTGQALTGHQITVAPSGGSTPSGGSQALLLTALNDATGAAVLTQAASSGKWNNGIIVGGVASTGAAYTVSSGLSCAAGIDLTPGAFTSANAVKLANNHRITWAGAGFVSGDSSGNLSVNPSGGATFYLNAGNTIQGTTLMLVQDAVGVASVVINMARGAAPNNSQCAISATANSVNNRSINAGGTVNANGADYAEYETKRADCGDVAKGQIVGFDAAGLVTGRFDDAVSFAVKSTNPNLVGGDVWDRAVGQAPAKPPGAPAAPIAPEQPQVPGGATEEEVAAIAAEWSAAQAAYGAAQADHAAALASQAEAVTAYQAELATWQAALEAARQTVDRIAYCGKVPVNVTGAAPGQYVVAIRAGDGSIAAELVDAGAITLPQYQAAVGRVRKILDDGRAEIVVKSI